MRTIGLSWSEWQTPWSSSKDDYVGTIEHLVTHLKEVLVAEQDLETRKELPSKSRALKSTDDLHAECPAPQMLRKTFKSLGTPTVQANALSSDRTELSREQLLLAAQRRRKELEDAGEIDWVCDRQPHATGQVHYTRADITPCRSSYLIRQSVHVHVIHTLLMRSLFLHVQGPAPNQSLVGKLLEVRWRYRHKETGLPVYIWCEGEVIQACMHVSLVCTFVLQLMTHDVLAVFV